MFMTVNNLTVFFFFKNNLNVSNIPLVIFWTILSIKIYLVITIIHIVKHKKFIYMRVLLPTICHAYFFINKMRVVKTVKLDYNELSS
jgi:hypothetical protein